MRPKKDDDDPDNRLDPCLHQVERLLPCNHTALVCCSDKVLPPCTQSVDEVVSYPCGKHTTIPTTCAKLQDLKTQLEARSGLSGVSVFKYAPLDQAPKKEMIYLGDANTGLEFQSFGSVYEEQIDLKCFVYVLRAGAGDSVAGTVESRAIALANEVIDQLSDDATINGAVIVSRMRNMTLENTLSDEGRICLIEMDIEAEATTSE